MKLILHISLLQAFLSFNAIAADTVDKQSESVAVWSPWEQVLTSSQGYKNPYRDVTLKVTYFGPSGQTFSGYVFWDGGITFKIHAAFPSIGVWTWETSCSKTNDHGLNQRSGTVTVVPYTGSNTLYQHGFLKVSDNHRFIAHADGTPFLLVGDTPWSAFVAASQSEWEYYLKNRLANKFTVVQVHCGNGFVKRETDREGNVPFLGTGENLRWNPAYWQQVEKKVRTANEYGIFVYICAVRQPAAWNESKDFPMKNVYEVGRFARNLAARLMGNFVMYSPIADDLWSPMAEATGQALNEATCMHLISAHPRFLLEAAVLEHKKDYIDVVGVQTGEGWTSDPYKKEPPKPYSTPLAAQNAYEWPLYLYQLSPSKPVINQEGPYDHPVGDDGRVSLPPHKAGYWSFLSGASGFNYGCFGIWNWGLPVHWMKTYDFQTSLNLPSVANMKYLAEFFGNIRWWTLEPHPELVPYQTTDPMHRVTVASSPSGDLIVAYLPDNKSIQLNLSGLRESMTARWFNPRSCLYEPFPEKISGSGSHIFEGPDGWDDAVLILSDTN